MRCFLLPSTQVVAACDVDKLKLERSAKNIVEKYYADKKDGAYKGCARYHDFRELLARPDIDAVVISTPDHWHAIATIEACRAGKDVYCEKPLTQTIAEAQAMVKTIRQYGRVFQTGSMQRSSPRVPLRLRAGAQRLHRRHQARDGQRRRTAAG